MSLDPILAKHVLMDEKAKQALLKDMQHFLTSQIMYNDVVSCSDGKPIEKKTHCREEITDNKTEEIKNFDNKEWKKADVKKYYGKKSEELLKMYLTHEFNSFNSYKNIKSINYRENSTKKEKHLGIMIAELQIRRSGEYLKYLNDFLWRPKTLCEGLYRWATMGPGWDTGWKNSYIARVYIVNLINIMLEAKKTLKGLPVKEKDIKKYGKGPFECGKGEYPCVGGRRRKSRSKSRKSRRKSRKTKRKRRKSRKTKKRRRRRR